LPNQGPKQGGFGQVVRCLDTLLNRQVVIKRILNPAELHRIVDEVVALQKAKSKHVVEIYDVLVTDGGSNISIVEEYLPGDDLTSVSFDPANQGQFYKNAYQISKAIQDIHDQDVVHRDIKHNNMKFDASGYIRIFDFGLAKIGPLPSSTMSVIGTPGYMAPELFSSSPVIDKPVDIYAFGALMFYLVSGKMPSCSRPWPQLPVALNPADSIASFGVQDAEISALIDRCLDLDPVKRPTAAELRKIFERKLLYGKHKATLVSASTTLLIDVINKPVQASHGFNHIIIRYDGFDFIVMGVQGSAFINNRPAVVGDALTGSHVITLGVANPRYFITFDASHPEVAI
jgi:serine/threonine protein kinase